MRYVPLLAGLLMVVALVLFNEYVRATDKLIALQRAELLQCRSETTYYYAMECDDWKDGKSWLIHCQRTASY
jgi:hypothetical protein